MDVSLQHECRNIKSNILHTFDNIWMKTLIYMLQSGALHLLVLQKKNWEMLVGQSREFHVSIIHTTVIWVQELDLGQADCKT